jgi:hypothetical protein
MIAVKEVPHPDYNGMTNEHDFRLIFLNETIAHDVKFVTLESSSQLSNELLESNPTQLAIMGWGDTIASKEIVDNSNKLMELI